MARFAICCTAKPGRWASGPCATSPSPWRARRLWPADGCFSRGSTRSTPEQRAGGCARLRGPGRHLQGLRRTSHHLAMRPDGEIQNMRPSGGPRSKPTLFRSSASCRSRPSIPASCSRRLSRSGWRSRRRPDGCADGWRRFSTGRQRAACARERTRLGGEGTSTSSCRRAASSPGCSTMRPCRIASCRISSRSCALKRGSAPRALEFTILTAARTGEVIGATWDEIDWPAVCGRSRRSA